MDLFLVVAAAAVLLASTGEVVAPFARCSPFVFINKIAESSELDWAFRDLPGHPVPDCLHDNPKDAPLRDQSIFLRPLDDPKSAPREIGGTIKFLLDNLPGRIARKLKGGHAKSSEAGDDW